MGGVSSIQFFVDYWNFFNFAKPLNAYSMIFLESITKQYMNSIPTGEMVSWTLYVLFLITMRTITNAMPKCCYDLILF